MKLLSILNIIIAVQAIFLCVHFSFKTKGIVALNRILALLLFCFALIVTNTYFNLSSSIAPPLFFQDLSNNAMWFIGPALYLYVIYLDNEPKKSFMLAHLLPYLVPMAIDLIFDWQLYDDYIPLIAFLQMISYLYLSLNYAIRHYAKAKQFYSWILPAIFSFAFLVILNITFRILGAFGWQFLSDQVLQSFTSLLAVPVFYLAYLEMNATDDLGIRPKKYQTSVISEENARAYLKKVNDAMEKDKLYLNNDLTLQSFAKVLGISAKYISQVINQYHQMSFTDYLLQFRLDAVKKNLADPDKKHLTISGIAQESGFKSASRFNYLFKKHTSYTPKAYQNKYLK